MKSFVCVLLVAQAVLQVINAQAIRVSGPLINSCAGPVIGPCGAPVIGSCGAPVIGSCGAPVLGPCGAPINACGCGQVLNPCGAPIITPAYAPVIAGPVIQSNSVAASLADTLSLLTVSSLLADTLPLGPNVYGVPVGCGCGGLPGCGCGGINYGSYYY